ncbi:MAG: serine/threonine-protein kinase, partial [Planctomycetota bacterium]
MSTESEQPVLQPGLRNGRYSYAPESKPLAGYTIKRGLGVGGFGEVYFAVSDAGKEVALKRIQRNLDVELRGVQNCLNLKHVNLISLWDIRTDGDGESWVVMEYVPGPSLRDIISVHENGMPGHQIERWFAPIAAGVSYLHDSGLVHRDLKPANIFLDEDEDVIKIGDYGLSKFISASKGSGQTETVGTFHYMAPEIGKGIYGKGIDIYAMGIVLYEMLTGDVPFDGESSHEIIMKHMTSDPDLNQIPDQFREVIRKSLAKDPEVRFASISEMGEYLPWSIPHSRNRTNSVNSKGSSRRKAATQQRSQPESNRDHEKSSKITEVFQRSTYEKGILFGPLKDSHGETSESEIVYINDTNTTDGLAKRISHSVVAENSTGKGLGESSTSSNSGLRGSAKSATSLGFKITLLLLAGLAITSNSSWLFASSLLVGVGFMLHYAMRMWFKPV